MNTKPQPTRQQEAAHRYRSVLLNYVKDLPEGKIFEERDISKATETWSQGPQEVHSGDP